MTEEKPVVMTEVERRLVEAKLRALEEHAGLLRRLLGWGKRGRAKKKGENEGRKGE